MNILIKVRMPGPIGKGRNRGKRQEKTAKGEESAKRELFEI